MKIPTFAALAILAAAPLAAKVSLAPFFGDHAVLQRDRPVSVWGSAAPGEAVMVQFHGLSARAVAGAGGEWKAVLPAMPASSYPSDLVVRSGNEGGAEVVAVHDIAVGEVWLRAGPANTGEGAAGSAAVQMDPIEVAAAHYPLIRQFTAEASGGGSWENCSPVCVPSFSVLGYFFARELYARLGVPVGIIAGEAPAGPVISRKFAELIQPVGELAVRGVLWSGADGAERGVAAIAEGRRVELGAGKAGDKRELGRQLAVLAVGKIYSAATP